MHFATKSKKFDFLVIGGGETPRIGFLRKLARQCDTIVTVDRGANTALRMGAAPSLHVGDDDSISKSVSRKMKVGHRKKLSPDKGISDLEYALDLLPKKSRKVIVGAHRDSEGRSDHVFVNFILASQRENTFLVDDRMWIANITKKKFRFQASRGTIFSVVSPTMSKTSRISISGARYNLKNKNLRTPSMGLSNVAINSQIEISARGPALLFVHESILNCLC